MPSRFRMLVATLEPLRCMVRTTTSVSRVSSMIRSLSLDRTNYHHGTMPQFTTLSKSVKIALQTKLGVHQSRV